jgi:beta-lactamase class A
MNPPLDPLRGAVGDVGVRWSGSVRGLPRLPRVAAGIAASPPSRAPLPAVADDLDAEVVRPVASVGKVLLLVEVARRLVLGELDPEVVAVRRTSVAPVTDSGLWQHLAVPRLSVADAASLVGAVSDNLATNALLATLGGGDLDVGIGAVAVTTRRLGLTASRLHDRVRDVRGASDPSCLATATATELVRLFASLFPQQRAAGPAAAAVDHHLGAPGTADLVRAWLGAGVDISLVAAGLDLDPLAHPGAAVGEVPATEGSGPGPPALGLTHKTGRDPGVRADVGVVSGPRGAVVYALVATWDHDRVGDTPAPAVRRAATAVGEQLAGLVSA